MNIIYWIIAIVLVVIFISFVKGYFRKTNISGSDFGYRKKERVINSSEQAFYINLQKVLGDAFIILSKVRIEDFVEVKNGNLTKSEQWSKRGRIKSRHVDFLICDMASSKPLLAIELDGLSHRTPDRIERDQFVNELYRQINLPVEHIRVGSDFFAESSRIKNLLLPNTN